MCNLIYLGILKIIIGIFVIRLNTKMNSLIYIYIHFKIQQKTKKYTKTKSSDPFDQIIELNRNLIIKYLATKNFTNH